MTGLARYRACGGPEPSAETIRRVTKSRRLPKGSRKESLEPSAHYRLRTGSGERSTTRAVAAQIARSLPQAGLPALQLHELDQVAAGVAQLGDGRASHLGRRHLEFGATSFDAL